MNLLDRDDTLLLVSSVAARRDESDGVGIEVFVTVDEVARTRYSRRLHQWVDSRLPDEEVAKLHVRLTENVDVRLAVSFLLSTHVENL